MMGGHLSIGVEGDRLLAVECPEGLEVVEKPRSPTV